MFDEQIELSPLVEGATNAMSLTTARTASQVHDTQDARDNTQRRRFHLPELLHPTGAVSVAMGW